jgi:hypothetical protein
MKHADTLGTKRMLGALLALGYTALFLYVIHRARFFNAQGLSARTIGGLFLLKILAGTALWYVYTYMHTDRATADIYRYFDDGDIMFSALPEHPMDYLSMLTGIGNDQRRFDVNYYQVMHNWYRQYESNMYNDAHTMIRFNAFVRLFSFGHYHVHTVFICFLCTVGLTALYKSMVGRIHGHERVWAFAIFLLPSVLFWSSGVIKEALLFFGLGLFLHAVMDLLRNGAKAWNLALLPFCIVLLFFLKFYVLLSLIPALCAYVWCTRTDGHRALLKYLATYAVFITIGLNSDLFYRDFRILEVLWVKQRDFIGMARAANSGSLVHVTELEPNVRSFLREAPHALYMTFLSPLTAWSNGALGVMSALENILLLVLAGMAVRWRRTWSEVDKPLLYFCLGYCTLLALVIGWTTPVIGALVRYRVPLLPFLLLAFMCIADPKRIPWPQWSRTNSPPE